MTTAIRPIWITVDAGETFSGHQVHWANCFFSNATRRAIRAAVSDPNFFGDTVSYRIREMSNAEMKKYPEAVEFCKQLVQEYGEC